MSLAMKGTRQTPAVIVRTDGLHLPGTTIVNVVRWQPQIHLLRIMTARNWRVILCPPGQQGLRKESHDGKVDTYRGYIESWPEKYGKIGRGRPTKPVGPNNERTRERRETRACKCSGALKTEYWPKLSDRYWYNWSQ